MNKPVSLTMRKGHLKFINNLLPNYHVHTIHRSQALTLDGIVFDTFGIWLHGLVYTTLSHVRNIKDLYFLHAIKKQNFTIKHKINSKMQSLQKSCKMEIRV